MPLRYTFRQLEYLVAVGEAGTIALAAQRINVSSPSISAAISQLEAEFGTQIFVRHHAQGLALTPGGRLIFNEARRILDRAAALTGIANDIADKPRGPIAIGCLTTIAPLLSASLRRSFQTEYPDATVTLREGHQLDLLHMLGRAEIDLAITYDLEIPKDIGFDPLLSLPPMVMLAQGHPLAARSQIDLADLAREAMILLDLPHSREYSLTMFQTAGLRPQVAERTAELAVLRSLVANGFGFGLVNSGTHAQVSPDGLPLCFRPLAGDHRPMVLGLASKQTAHRPRIIRAFYAHLQARAGQGDLPGMQGNVLPRNA